MKRSTILIFGLFSTSFACPASANEVAFTCDYQLGTGTGAGREKIGSVAVAIDVKNKSARIDFGKGWFKTNTLQVHGTNVKEMPPSTSGNKLGLFYFDLNANSGGFSGEGFHEFFSSCVQDNTVRSTTNAPDKSGMAAGDAAHRKQATESTNATETTVAPRASARAVTEYYGRSTSRSNPAWAAEATINPAYQKQATQLAAAPAAVNEPAPPQTGGKATTEYYGRPASPENPAWAAEATMNVDYDRNTLPANDTSAKSPATIATLEAPKEPCSGALDAAVRTADLYFSNASFVLGSQSKTGLKKIAEAITACGNVTVEVGGYTDDWGNPDYNKTLSQRRADAVVEYLVKEGVDSSKLKAVGYGQERPIATNRTPAGRRLNRRVEFRIAGP